MSHFSKYGLSDSDEDEDLDPALQAKLMKDKLAKLAKEAATTGSKLPPQKPKSAAVAALLPEHHQPSLGGISEEEFMESREFSGDAGFAVPKMVRMT